jgi:hypothetical protein
VLRGVGNRAFPFGSVVTGSSPARAGPTSLGITPRRPAPRQEGSPDMSRRFISPRGEKGQAIGLPDKEFRSPESAAFTTGRTISSSGQELLADPLQRRAVSGVHARGDLDDLQ